MKLRSWSEAFDFYRARGLSEREAEIRANALFGPNALTGVVRPFPDAEVEELHAGRDEDDGG